VFARLDQDRAPSVVGKESKASKAPRKSKAMSVQRQNPARLLPRQVMRSG
jgi:hypothetical protein